MGQYHQLVNFERKEVVHPHKLGLGLKQAEHTGCPASLSDALYMLVCTSPSAGGGDLLVLPERELEFKSFWRWVGDIVTVFWDYTDASELALLDRVYPNDWARDNASLSTYIEFFTDITDQLIPAFEAAYGVKIEKDSKGWRERNLVAEEWSWLFPDLDDEKTA